jgi:hypothetical protein
MLTLNVSPETESRLMQEAQRRDVSVEALVESLISEQVGCAPAPRREPETANVFEQGLGLFGSPEDAALIDAVVSLAYTERRRPSQEQPLSL